MTRALTLRYVGAGSILGAMDARIRESQDADRQAIVALADRLQEGVAAWRDPDGVRDAVRGWVVDSLNDLSDPDSAAFVAERDGSVVGFVCVSERKHFTGEVDTYIGELVVSREAEGTGIGRALVDAALAWGRDRGRRRVVVDTGAANISARAFYAALGFQEEDITISRSLPPT